MRNVRSRLASIQQRIDARVQGDDYCDCKPVRFWVAMQLEKPPCQAEVHNPRPKTIRPEVNRAAIMEKLFPGGVPEQADNYAMETKEAKQQLDLLPDPEPEPEREKTGDAIRDAVAERLIQPKLNREQLANKLLVPTKTAPNKRGVPG